jgi:hypothetical protein
MTDMTNSHLTDKTTSHSNKLSIGDNPAAGYKPAQNLGQVIGHGHLAWQPEEGRRMLGYAA